MKDSSIRILFVCPGKIPKTTSEIHCFTDVVNYYLPSAMASVVDTTVIKAPLADGQELRNLFHTINLTGYDAIVVLGLRFFSKVSIETFSILRSRFPGLICQVHDGSRLDYDPVDITFTFKDDTERMSTDPSRLDRHAKSNVYMGWAADPELNFPRQSESVLRILIDHTNYGDNPIDWTDKILSQVKDFVESDIWRKQYKSVSVRRFDSGRVLDVDMNNLSYERYDRTRTMTLSEITREHSEAHVFCVTHPESVGLVVLETATAGALIVTPQGFIPKDRLRTVRHVEWGNTIDWSEVLDSIDINHSRAVALENTWDKMARNIANELKKRLESNK